jgi:hypothetical protein
MVLTEPSLLVYINKCCKPWTCETIKIIHTLDEIGVKSSNIKLDAHNNSQEAEFYDIFIFKKEEVAEAGADPRTSAPSWR